VSPSYNLPNAITTVRVLLAPVVAYLLFQPEPRLRVLAFMVFLVAALSDLWDGHLARTRGEITDFGKLVDPMADKLLVVATLVPFYLITHAQPQLGQLPLYGGIALWILVVLFGREIIVTWLRAKAARQGQVVPAARSGKYKAFAQNVFIGSMILWLAWRTALTAYGWEGFPSRLWGFIHGWFTTVALTVAIVLTVVSLLIYLRNFRHILGTPRAA
jgi:CDP-diacylglycerol--glycerol-3-phosphate 3-phosphatidyltransferase